MKRRTIYRTRFKASVAIGAIAFFLLTGLSGYSQYSISGYLNTQGKSKTVYLGQKLRNGFLEFKLGLQKYLLPLSKESELIVASQSVHYVQLDQPELVINAIKKIIDLPIY